MKKKVEKIVYKKIDEDEEIKEKIKAITALVMGVHILLYVYKTIRKRTS